MSSRIFIANTITDFLPPSRFFYFKAAIYRIAGVEVHKSARLVSSVKIWGSGKVVIGANTFVGHEVLILTGAKEIFIGSDVDIGPRVTLVNGTHAIDMLGPRTAGIGISYPIIINDGAWVGAGTTIIGGCCIGEKSLIGAGSVVVSDIPSKVIAVGNPCKPIKRWDELRNEWVKI